jgi:hypothetical protein
MLNKMCICFKYRQISLVYKGIVFSLELFSNMFLLLYNVQNLILLYVRSLMYLLSIMFSGHKVVIAGGNNCFVHAFQCKTQRMYFIIYSLQVQFIM